MNQSSSINKKPGFTRSIAVFLLLAVFSTMTLSACGSESASVEKFCESYIKFDNDFNDDTSLDITNPETLSEALKSLEELNKNAPDEVAEATQFTVDLFKSLKDADQATMFALIIEKANDMERYTTQLDEYTLANCG